jgi:hypothetical protein
MMPAMLIARRFCGPPDSGNGGYTAGLLASALGASVDGAHQRPRPIEVTLRRPPPLERELDVKREGEQAQLLDGELLLAEARLATVDVTAPNPPSFEQATELSHRYVGHARHHFPTCFVCGPKRAIGDGLRIFPGSEEPGQPVAAPLVPDASLGDAPGVLPPEIVWAALDCIGYFGVGAPDYPTALLGRMAVELVSPVRVGERCVVVGFPLGRDGRKLHAGTALFGQDGTLRGRARQTWIVVPEPTAATA